eukprot:CAMPEP_0177648214 /NCGR_PEP_ID=MMETSP0447-20121125/10711_1 /TAXON_ID=0 /ORGANISM="Stygamoeba regulata, Strain BSH-02190019" /LENGTH=929 /DNA_ID=CAMNT_0019150845 /DNA_START=268 /DNA_END=3057 /DNA_ORIENTATION=+
MKVFLLLVLLLEVLLLVDAGVHAGEVKRVVVNPVNAPSGGPSGGARYVAFEFLEDNLLHVEVSGERAPPASLTSKGIYTTQMVDGLAAWNGVSSYSDTTSNNIRTFTAGSLRVDVNQATLTVTVTDIGQSPNLLLTTFSYLNLQQTVKTVQFSNEFANVDVYGAGSHFKEPYGVADGSWAGLQWRLVPGNPYGNAVFALFEKNQWKGMSEMASFPVVYFVDGAKNYAIFMDNVYRKEWYFDRQPFNCQMWGNTMRFYVISGPDLPTLRTTYMKIVGHPLVPPKRMLGMWQSIFGYRSFDHAFTDLNNLTQPSNTFERFPVDGMGFDIYWFGGNFYQDDPISTAETSTMGSLHWDKDTFPDPGNQVYQMTQKGAAAMVISESYVSKGANGYGVMASKNYLVRDCATCGPTILGEGTEDHWWGVGGMVDWSNQEGADFWFDCKYCPLIAGCKVDGNRCSGMLFDQNNPQVQQSDITAFWLDLGEPEMYHGYAYYSGYSEDDGTEYHEHGDVCNIYQLLWTKSIHDGFLRNNIDKRPWTLSRTGTSGLHRYGASMWSGDIWPELEAMSSSLGIQKDLSMCGIDYFGSDVGGFERKFLEDNEDEKYTMWFANSAWFDVPFRPHAWQPDFSDIETAPSRVGRLTTNLFNSRNRYALTPYYYSLAHRANRYGEPVIPPLYYYYQKDSNTRGNGNVKMIGRDVLVGVSGVEDQFERKVYLPQGTWYDFYRDSTVYRAGADGFQVNPYMQYINRPRYCSGTDTCLLVCPVFVRAGALLPKMWVDENTKNTLGERWVNDQNSTTLIVRAYQPDGPQENQFTVFEDDGETNRYLQGDSAVQTTLLRSIMQSNMFNVTAEASYGTYTNAPTKRDIIVEAVFLKPTTPGAVRFNNSPLMQVYDQDTFEGARNGVWYQAAPGEVWAKAPSVASSLNRSFSFA